MLVSLIAAMAKNRVIGRENAMPWHLPADFRHLKRITLGKPIVMGRKTADSIGKPLPGRRNVVISRQAELEMPGFEVFDSLEAAFAVLEGEAEVVIFGGQGLYEHAMPYVTRMYLTFIELVVEGDAFFPEWSGAEWREAERVSHPADEKNRHPYTFVTLERIARDE